MPLKYFRSYCTNVKVWEIIPKCDKIVPAGSRYDFVAFCSTMQVNSSPASQNAVFLSLPHTQLFFLIPMLFLYLEASDVWRAPQTTSNWGTAAPCTSGTPGFGFWHLVEKDWGSIIMALLLPALQHSSPTPRPQLGDPKLGDLQMAEWKSHYHCETPPLYLPDLSIRHLPDFCISAIEPLISAPLPSFPSHSREGEIGTAAPGDGDCRGHWQFVLIPPSCTGRIEGRAQAQVVAGPCHPLAGECAMAISKYLSQGLQ